MNHYPTRAQAIRRRVVAAVIFLAGLGIAGWVAARGLDAAKDESPQQTTTVAPVKELRITFPEGWTRDQMARRVDAVLPRVTGEQYRAASVQGTLPKGFTKPENLEGFLFPDTYFVFENARAKTVVDKQLANFAEKWSSVKLQYARSKNLTSYDVLTIASMIEKEAKVQKERPLIAAVIYNRLRARIPLGIDATLRYGLAIPPNKAITQDDLASDSPYNTRRFQGLPPTPIANPGLPSIKAAARPANVDYLYFVRKPDCKTHFFTSSLEEFNDFTREGLEKTCPP